ncbi:MAG: CapA family protein [Muribaculaceae bacterium]|nr:CapA family protein [Muribaculaceae bacterium]
MTVKQLLLIFALFLSGCGATGADNRTGADSLPEDSLAATRQGAREITLLFAGDAMQHQAQLDQARIRGGAKGYDYSQCFDLIAPTVKEADYAVVNLEVPLGGGPVYRGYPCFSAPDSFAEALRDAGFDLFLTSNNHCLDSGMKAARRTLTALDSIGVDHIGTYNDSVSRERLTPFIRDIKGFRIAFLNYTYGTNGIEPRDGMEVAMIDRPRMAREIEAAKRAGAEIVVVTVHWGVEYVLTQNSNQESLAQFLLNQGTDLVIGSHPHVIQPMQVVENDSTGKKSLVVYSLGNFISNMKTADTRGGALVRVVIERGDDGKARFREADYDTFLSAKPTGKHDNYRVIPSWMTDSIPAGQREHWSIFNRGAERIFNQYNKNVPRKHK